MSYDFQVVDSVTGEIERSKEKHNLIGGTYCMGGTHNLTLNITYNYCRFYYPILGIENGIRGFHGMRVADTIPVLEKAIPQLGDDTDDDYWKPTEGNAKIALMNLLMLAKFASANAVWDVS